MHLTELRREGTRRQTHADTHTQTRTWVRERAREGERGAADGPPLHSAHQHRGCRSSQSLGAEEQPSEWERRGEDSGDEEDDPPVDARGDPPALPDHHHPIRDALEGSSPQEASSSLLGGLREDHTRRQTPE